MVETINDTGKQIYQNILNITSQKESEKWPKSNDKTDVINDETEETERDRKDFIIFDDYRRRLKRVKPGRLKINEDKNGEKYASIEIKKWDCPEMDEENGDIKTERNELWLDKECDFEFNKDFKYKFSFKIPEDFPLSPTRLVIWQWKYNKIEGSNENEDPSPILAQRIKKIDWKYYFIITDWTKKKNVLWKKIPLEDIKGKRIDMDYEINFSDKKRPVGNNATPSTLKVKAKIEWWKGIDIYDWKFNLEEMNNLVLDPKKSHTWYFKFWLYRDSYNYTIRKIRDKNDIKEIEQAKEAEKRQPTKIYFKNFSMKNLNHEKVEQELDESKKENQKKVETLQEYYNSYIDIILAIKNLKEPKDIRQNLSFLNDQKYIEATQNKYQEVFNTLKNNSKILDNLEEKINKKDTEELLALKKEVDNLKLIRNYQRLKKYENWEYITLPNWLSYELCTKSWEEKFKKTTPNEIKLWENDCFIKAHVDINASYTEFIPSLLKIKDLLKNKWINVKYCEYESWLANKNFLRKYEETIKQKFGDKYKKTQKIQVLEQIEPAEIFYKIIEWSNPVDKPQKSRNSLRFIGDKPDLLEYLEQWNNKKEFNEADMWLDLDKLVELQQTLDKWENWANNKDEAVVQEQKNGTRNESKPEKTIQNNNGKKKKRKFFRKIKIKIKKLFEKFKKIFKRK